MVVEGTALRDCELTSLVGATLLAEMLLDSEARGRVCEVMLEVDATAPSPVIVSVAVKYALVDAVKDSLDVVSGTGRLEAEKLVLTPLEAVVLSVLGSGLTVTVRVLVLVE